MADEQEQATVSDEVAVQAPEDTGEPAVVQLVVLPTHLNASWFDTGVTPPEFMNHPNWMNMNGTLVTPVYVEMNGAVHPTNSPIHLGHWLMESHGVVVAAPTKED